MLNDLKCLPINFYLLTMFDALCDVTPSPAVVTFFIAFTNVFLSRFFYVFNVFYFYLNVFYIYAGTIIGANIPGIGDDRYANSRR